ncbi:MAG: site-specific integrase [Phycisphaera sp.]|nr:MAG: site-specific integrase [Phycisphaera sp.]
MTKPRTGSLYERPGSRYWYGSWTEPATKRRRTKRFFTDKAASRQALDQCIKRSERQAAGLEDRCAEQLERPIGTHIDAYFKECLHRGQAARHIATKRTQLARFTEETDALADLTRDHAVSVIETLKEAGLSARTLNSHASSVSAFMKFCVRTSRISMNPLTDLPRFNEAKDRRRERRALTDTEIARLLTTCPVERRPVYEIAVLTGLRRSELAGITWGDLDLDRNLLRVREDIAKASRSDTIALHPDAVRIFSSLRPADAAADGKVFDSLPTIRTVRRDYERARIALRDELGRSVDFHALRTTAATRLARAGITPQVAQKLMRHRDFRTTLRYMVLELDDQARAMEMLQGVRTDG